jgi:hypothetical protein
MQRIYYLIFFVLFLNNGCRRDGANYNKQVHDRLHGKYKVVSSTTSQAVDVDMDGTANIDLLSEMDYLNNCEFAILIAEKREFLFSLLWPEQYLNPGVNPPMVNFACQGRGRFFTIAADNTTLVLKPDDIPSPDPDRWNFPSSVTITGKDRIQVVLNKKLFTSAGWQSVTITTVYERYTMVT